MQWLSLLFFGQIVILISFRSIEHSVPVRKQQILNCTELTFSGVNMKVDAQALLEASQRRPPKHHCCAVGIDKLRVKCHIDKSAERGLARGSNGVQLDSLSGKGHH